MFAAASAFNETTNAIIWSLKNPETEIKKKKKLWSETRFKQRSLYSGDVTDRVTQHVPTARQLELLIEIGRAHV